MDSTLTVSKPKWSVKAKTIATVIAVCAAVALPQLFHGIGIVTGTGTVPGETFLPMHLPIILVGLLAGPVVGCISGAASPIISFLLSGMPVAAMLPYMIVELAAYGLFAGMLRNVRMYSIFKVLIVQAAGRAAKSAAILIAVGAAGVSMDASAVWTGIAAGFPGLILQWIFIPLFIYWFEHKISEKNE